MSIERRLTTGSIEVPPDFAGIAVVPCEELGGIVVVLLQGATVHLPNGNPLTYELRPGQGVALMGTDHPDRLNQHLPEADKIGQRVLGLPSPGNTKPGPKRGDRVKFRTPDKWHAAIHRDVLSKPKALVDANPFDIAFMLGISHGTLRNYMKKWGPKTIKDLKEGNF